MAKKRKQRKYRKPSKAMLVAAVFTATLLTALLSFISVELALLGFGLFSLGALSYVEARRRGFWETAASFKFKSLKDGQDALAMDMADRERELEILRMQMRRIMTRVEELRNAKTARITGLDPQPAALFPAQDSSPPRPLKAAQNLKPPPPKGTGDFNGISDNVVQTLLRNAVDNKRVDVFVQPIVRLPQRQKRFYEVFARIRAQPGQYMSAQRYMPVAEQDNLQNKIDDLLLLNCLKTVQTSAHIKNATPFFINITSDTLKSKLFMSRLLGFVSKHRTLAERLIFEIRQADFEELHPALLEVLKGLGTLGCSFSLDHVQALDFDIAELQRFKVRFIKIDQAVLLNGASIAKTLRAKNILEANGVGVIVQKIESEDDMRRLIDFDIRYGQGYLFGKPDLQGAYASGKRARREGFKEAVA